MAALPDVDHTAHLDTQSRTSGHHRTAVRAAHVWLAARWSVAGTEPTLRRWSRRKDRGTNFTNKDKKISKHNQHTFKNTKKKLIFPFLYSYNVMMALAWGLLNGHYTISVKLNEFTVWCHNWRKKLVNCAVFTGNSAGLRTVLSSRLSHRELRSSLKYSHKHSVQFFVQFFTQLKCAVWLRVHGVLDEHILKSFWLCLEIF